MITKKESGHVCRQAGQVLVLAIIVVGLVLINALAIIGGARIYSQNTKYSVDSTQAMNLAEAGIEKAIATLNKTAGSYNGDIEKTLDQGSYSVTVTNKNASTKVITSTGYIPNKTNSKVTRSVSVDVFNGEGTAFNYAIQIGEGGLKMDQGSTVKGSIYSNGNVKLDEDSKIIGDVWVANGTAIGADQQAECSGSNCVDFIFGKNVSGQDRFDIAQSFKPADSQVINKVALKLKKFGNPPNVTVRILKDNDGSPNKSEVMTSGTLSANMVTTAYSFVEVALNQNANLSSDHTYWIMIDTSSDYSNYWSWSADSAQSYTRGSAKWSAQWNTSHPDWHTPSPNIDLAFQTFMGGTVTYIDGDYDHHNGTIITGDAHANTLRDLTIQKGAYYQTATHISAAQSYPGSTDPTPKAFPISEGNMAEWKQQATDLGVHDGNISNCLATIPAGKYVGNVTLPHNCRSTFGSPVWITGNLDIQENANIKLDSSFGASSGVTIVDGFIDLDKDGKADGSGTPGSYIILLSNFNSRDDQGGDDNHGRDAIRIHRDGNTGVLYAGLGSIRLSKDNHITSITAWKVTTSKDVILEYDQGLAGTFFSFGPSGSYSVVKGTYQVK